MEEADMATTETPYRVLSLHEEARADSGDRAFVRLDSALDIGAFAVGAAFQPKTGETVVPDHHEAGPGGGRHEELYVVVQGSAVFTVEGEEIDAPQGTAVFVHEPGAMRKAVATEDDTMVLAVGGPRGEAYRLTPARSQDGFWEAYRAGDYASALEATKRGLEIYPGNANLLYNVACMEALLGNHDDALTALAESVAQWEPYKEQAREDDDFASLRDDSRFVELVGAA
jgi:mannose-6-phosphate isomerase-like protein (cupin superfamily)